MSTSANQWVTGVKHGQTYYLNLDTLEETFLKPKDFDSRDDAHQDCTDIATKYAVEQLQAGDITQEEFDLIISKIKRGQEVDDIDQFLNNGPDSEKFNSKGKLPEEVTSDPALVITDLSTGKKVHIVSAKDELPVQRYDTFENLYVVDKDTGRKTFLSDVQVEQFDTFRDTQKQLGARAGAAELRRKAKQIRDAAPAPLKLKLYNALRDLDKRLQTPSGQRVLVGESPYFGGSLVKTRAAMVMAVQVKLKRVWLQQSRNKSATKEGKEEQVTAVPGGSQDLMNLAEFVDVLQLMGFNATLESASEVVHHWGKADAQGRIHFREFLQWCDLDSCFVKNNDVSTAGAPAQIEMAGMSTDETNVVANPSYSHDESELMEAPGNNFPTHDRIGLAATTTASDPEIAGHIQRLRCQIAEAEAALNSNRLNPLEAAEARTTMERLNAELAGLAEQEAGRARQNSVFLEVDDATQDQSAEATALIDELVSTIGEGAGESPRRPVDAVASSDDSDDDAANALWASADSTAAISTGLTTVRASFTTPPVGTDLARGVDSRGRTRIHQLESIPGVDGGMRPDTDADHSHNAQPARDPDSDRAARISGNGRIHQLSSVDGETDCAAQIASKGKIQQMSSLEQDTKKEKTKKKKKKKKKSGGSRKKIMTIDLDPVDEVRALYAFSSTESSELSMQVGDVLTVYKQDDSGWWWVKNVRGEEGFVPFNYVQSTGRFVGAETGNQ